MSTIIDEKKISSLPIGKPLSPNKALPVDRRCMFSNMAEAEAAAASAKEIGSKDSVYYYGMKVCVDDKEEGILAWFTIQRDGTLLADDSDGSRLTSQKLIGQDANGGNIYEQTFSDGTKVRFVAPRGETGVSMPIDNHFSIDVDNDGNLVLYYVDGETPPPIDYDPETGNLAIELNGKKTNIGNVKGKPGDTVKVKSIDFDGRYDANGGAIHKMTFEDGSSFDFVAPRGKEGKAGADGADGTILDIKGHYYLDVEDDDLVLYYNDEYDPPPLEYNPEDGHLYLKVDDFIKTSLGCVKGKDGKGSDINLEKGSAKNALQQVGNTAGAKGYKITGATSLGNGKGQYTLRNASGIVEGMKYVSCTSEMNAVGGNILSVSGNIVEVDGYLSVDLKGSDDNTDTGDVYNYLIIVDHPELGDMEIGYGAVSLGDGSVVYAKNGFSAAKNGKVLGKHGSVFGKNTEAGHCAGAGGEDVKALGSCSFGWGFKLLAKALGAVVLGIGHKALHWGLTIVGRYSNENTITENDRFVVGAGTSDTNKINCFSAGYYNGTSYIKVGGVYVPAAAFNAIKDLTGTNKAVSTNALNDTLKNYAKKSDIPTNSSIASEFANNIDFEMVDGILYAIIKTED